MCIESVLPVIAPMSAATVPLSIPAPELRRRKLWELDSNLHCSVIGTCVPVKELRRIYQRVQKTPARKLSDHDLHALFVKGACSAHDSIRLLQKYLEKTYQTAVRRFSSARTTEELQTLWQSAVADDDVPGAYWALLTHSRITPKLVDQAFGEVHMLSHLSGRNRQQEQRRQRTLAQENQSLRQTLDQRLDDIARLHAERQQLEQALRQDRIRLHQQDEQLQVLQQTVATLRDQLDADALDQQIARLERQLAIAEQQAADAKHGAEQLAAENTRLQQQQTVQPVQPRQTDTPDCAASGDEVPDLCGRCILYVGGRAGTRARFRHRVERCNGRYLYHDGGQEDGRKRLAALLSRADAVICPLDRVSHGAVNEIKSLCKTDKPVIMLRNTSLTAFNSALNRIAR